MRGIPLRSIAAVAIAFVAAAIGLAGAHADPGDDRPTNGGWCPRAPCTPRIVIDRHRDFTGRVETISFSYEGDLCRADDHLKYPIKVTFCPRRFFPEGPVEVGTVGAVTSRTRPDFTEITGYTSPQVRDIGARLRGDEGKIAESTFVRVKENLAKRLGQKRPFGAFSVLARDCVPGDRFVVVAFDRRGKKLGKDREPAFADTCEGVEPLPRATPGTRVYSR